MSSNRIESPIGARFRRLRKSFRDPRVCVLAAWMAGTAVAFLIIAIQGIPAPAVHDEFAYLLGADTFASGRTVSQTHPMWQHFETFHVIHQPGYTCKYPPGQSLALALGQTLGHPVIGVCLSTGISIAALVWMLIGWLPRKYYWLVVLFTVFHPGLHLIWGQSYWSGAVALTGASLLVGAFGRLTGKMEIRYALIAGLGTVLLANSRPFEGAVLTAAIGAGLIYRLVRNSEWRWSEFLRRVIVPGGSVLGVGFGLMLLYNQSVTGHALQMPYQIHEATYGLAPVFLWETAGEKPQYRHQVMEDFFVGDHTAAKEIFASAQQVLDNKSKVGRSILSFFCSEAGWIAILGLPWLFRKPRYRLVSVMLVPVFLAALATPWSWSQYFAPAAPLLLLLFFGGFIEAWTRTRKIPAARLLILVVAPLFYLGWYGQFFGLSSQMNNVGWANDRVAIAKQLNDTEGKDLVLVRYADDHNAHNEWVYNAANIDGAEIVWAREMSDQDRKALLHYFHDRRVWIVEADANPPRLTPFESTCQTDQ